MDIVINKIMHTIKQAWDEVPINLKKEIVMILTNPYTEDDLVKSTIKNILNH